MNKLFLEKTKVVVVLGPTSSGKSDLAIAIAKNFGGEIISADSRQIYQDMDLGTGKVEGNWKSIKTKNASFKAFLSEDIPHHLLDFCSPKDEYNVSDFKIDCEGKIREISKRNNLPIICGGTGFWIDAVTKGIILPKVAPNLALRKELEQQDTKELVSTLEKLDSKRSSSIDKKNRVRLIRAIEIAKSLGSVPEIKNVPSSEFQFLEIGIDWPQEQLDQKIKKRLNNRWQAGMTKEIFNLKEKYNLSWEKIQSFGLGYYWIPLFLQKEIDEKELRKRVFIAERGYAKRQKTWFYRNENISWENDQKKSLQLVKKFLK